MKTPKFQHQDTRAKDRWPLKHKIKAQRGTMSAIAKHLGVSVVAVSNWLDGRIDSSKIESAVKAHVEEMSK